MKGVIRRAKEFAYLMHKGQTRKEGIPFITHPAGVVRILEEIVSEEEDIILSIAWLHDILEDTPTTYNHLNILFGKAIADRVYLLSRNIGREEYKKRIENSDYIVKLVKLADTLHNIYNPYSLIHLSQKGVQRKLEDCKEFYIPLAIEVCPSLGCKLIESVDNYLKFVGGYGK